MPLPFFGPISLDDIQSEFGGSNPIAISEYYRGGSYTPSGRLRVPTGGQIKLSDFYTSNNTGTLRHVFDDIANENIFTNGYGASFEAINLNGASGPWNGSFDSSDKYYRVTFFAPFPNTNYSVNITITDNQSASGAHANFIILGDIGNQQPGSFDIQFVSADDVRISYVREFQASCDWLG